MLDPRNDGAPHAATNHPATDTSKTEGFPSAILSIGASAAAVLDMLNEVTEAKRRGILELAESAAGHHVTSSPQRGPNLADAIAQARKTAGNIERGAEDPIGVLEHAVVNAITLAIHNTVAADQALDTIGQAVLAQASAILLQRSSRKNT